MKKKKMLNSNSSTRKCEVKTFYIYEPGKIQEFLDATCSFLDEAFERITLSDISSVFGSWIIWHDTKH